tara:strand:- start:791 stop:1027 length:237 start_codon:yes stop_codon:yes gene_type:complete
MTMNAEIYGTQTSYEPSKKYSMKRCSISGKRFKATTENFYVNNNSKDGLHPYHKEFDNFRRSTGASTERVRKLINLVK